MGIEFPEKVALNVNESMYFLPISDDTRWLYQEVLLFSFMIGCIIVHSSRCIGSIRYPIAVATGSNQPFISLHIMI